MARVRRFLKRVTAPFAVILVVIATSLALAAPAYAATGTVITPSGQGLYVRSGPGTSYSAIGELARGTVVSFNCYAVGTAVTGPYGTETAWDKLDSGGYVSDAWIFTGNNSAVVPQCGPSVGCYAKSCVGKNYRTQGCWQDAKIVNQSWHLWEPGDRSIELWEYHSNACDAAWIVPMNTGRFDDGDTAYISVWNPGGPSQHFTFSVGNYGKITATTSAMVDDENGVQVCTGAQMYYLKPVVVNGVTKWVNTYYTWDFAGCR
jgi:hypothetical protein